MKYLFESYKSIPNKLRKIAKEIEGVDDIRELTLSEINNILNDYEQEDHVQEYKVEYMINNDRSTRTTFISNDLNETLVLMDRLTDYGYGTNNTIAFYQNDKLVKVYAQKEWKFPKNSIYQ